MDDEIREALWTRGATNSQIDFYRVGYFEGELPLLNYPKDFLKWCSMGTTIQSMLVFPLTTSSGDIRGLQFRSSVPAIKGYRDYTPYPEEPVFFGLAQAVKAMWETEEACVVEGAFDLFPVQRQCPGTVATLTSHVPRELARLLRRFLGTLWILYDRDSAGIKGGRKFLSEYRDYFTTKIIQIPKVPKIVGEGWIKDPAELWEAWGDERFGVFWKQNAI
jgi:DNA primase